MMVIQRESKPWGVVEVTVECNCGRVSIYGIKPDSENCRCTNPLCLITFPIADLREPE